MQDGFTFQGLEAEIEGGSFGRVSGSIQGGKQVGNIAGRIAIEGIHEDGFRRVSSIDIRNLYGDVGYKANGGEDNLTFELTDNGLRRHRLRQRDAPWLRTQKSSLDV